MAQVNRGLRRDIKTREGLDHAEGNLDRCSDPRELRRIGMLLNEYCKTRALLLHARSGASDDVREEYEKRCDSIYDQLPTWVQW